MVDTAVQNLVISNSARFERTGRIVPIRSASFFVGDHGPFQVDIDEAEYAPEIFEARINKVVADLRQMGAVKSPTG